MDSPDEGARSPRINPTFLRTYATIAELTLPAEPFARALRGG
jgi:hypothetical protein